MSPFFLAQINNTANYFSLLVPLLLPFYPNLVFLVLLPLSSKPYQVLVKWFPRPRHLSSPDIPNAPLQISVQHGCSSHNSPCEFCPSLMVLSITVVTFSPCELLQPAVSHTSEASGQSLVSSLPSPPGTF